MKFGCEQYFLRTHEILREMKHCDERTDRQSSGITRRRGSGGVIIALFENINCE
jgi:hypothetical protein